jgi:glyoxylase-like metal-dependent hydrolase (beta-lactamase superfamily II)
MTAGLFVVDGLMIDTGPPNAREEIERVLEQVRIDQVVITHHHEDHCGNAAFVAERRGIQPMAHALALPELAAPPVIPAYRRVTWGTPEPCGAIALPAEVHTPSHRFEVIHTPGHSHDHIALYEPEQHWLFTGDLYVTSRPKVLGRSEVVGALIDSLRRLMCLPDCAHFCSHAGIHRSHQSRIGAKLDYLLWLQERVLIEHEEGRTVREITRHLKLGNRTWQLVSRGQYSGENLVRALLLNVHVDV